MELLPGTIYKIQTNIGFGFLQYVETTELELQYIRIIDKISQSGELKQDDVNKTEKWCVEFPLKAAIRKRIVEKVDKFDLPVDFQVSILARTEHIIQNKFIGWHIVNRQTLHRQLLKELTEEDLKLSPYGIWNDTLIIERLESNWKLKDWK